MISATDSFIQYLNSQLAGNPPVAWIRPTATDPTSGELKMDTLNVSVLAFTERGSGESALVSLDIIGSDQRQVFGWARRVRDLLIEQQYTPELDYESNPASPAALGRLVSWDGREVDFQVVRVSSRMVHLNATFQLFHVRQ